MLQKPVVLLAFAYLAVGTIWALTFGIYSIERRVLSEERPHYDHVIRVESAQLTAQGYLIICMSGRREEADYGDTPIETFSVAIPPTILWQSAETLESEGFEVFSFSDAGAVYIPRRHVLQGCLQSTSARPVAVRTLQIPAKIPRGWYPQLELVDLHPPVGERYAIYESPIMKGWNQPSGYVAPILVRERPDGEKPPYFEIAIQSIKKKGTVAPYELVGAFAVDALIWPVEIAMWLQGGH